LALLAGTAELPVVPRIHRDFSRQLMRQMGGPAVKAGERAGHDSGRRFGLRFNKQLGSGFSASAGIARRAAGVIGAAFAGAAVVGGLKSIIDAASDMNETVNKSNVIFGKSSAEIRRWARSSATDFGLSRTEAIGAAASFGDMFLQLKLGQPAATNMSKGMVELAADFASFHNADITEVLEAQSAAFRGEYDSLQRFIPAISAARVEQEALRMTHKKSAKELTLAEKAQAVYNIMLKDGARAVGDFDRTSEGAANRQRILTARIKDLKASLGQGLLPAYASVLGFLNDKLIPAVSGFSTRVIPAARRAMATLRERAGEIFDTPFKVDLKNLADKAKGWAGAIIGGFKLGLRTGDWSGFGELLGNIIRRITAGSPQFLHLVAQSFRDTVRESVGQVNWREAGKQAVMAAVPFVLGFVGGMIDALINAFRKDFWGTVLDVLTIVPIGRAAGILFKVFGKLPILGSLLKAISTAGRGVEKPIFAVVASIGRFFVRAFQRAFPEVSGSFGRWLTSLIFGIAGRYNQMKRAAGRFVAGLLDGIEGQAGLVIRNIAQLIGWVTKPFRTAGGWLLRRGGQVVTGLIRGVEAIGRGLGRVAARVIGWLLTPFRPAAGWLVARGSQAISGLVRGVMAALGATRRAALSVIRTLTSPFRPAIRWLVGAGGDLVRGLRRGIDAGIAHVGGVLGRLKDAIVGGIKRLFGISSPSKVMAGLGSKMVAGLVKGLVTNTSSLRKINGSMGGGIRSQFASMFAELFGGGGGGSAKGLVGYASTAFQFFKDMFPGMTIGGWRATGSVPGSDHPKGKALDLMTGSNAIAQRIISMFMDLPGKKYWIWNRQIATASGGWQPRPYSGPSPHTDHVHLSFYKQGAWKLLEDQLGYLHKGEMVVPAGPAERLRQGSGGGGVDEDRLARKIAAELAKVIPTSITVRDFQAGMNRNAGRMGQARPFR
jgi:hypothetical protein